MSKAIVKRKQGTLARMIGGGVIIDVVIIYYMSDAFQYNEQSHIYVGSVGLDDSDGEPIPTWNDGCSAAKKEYGIQYKLWGNVVMADQLARGDNR
jgi:hypothetical protein